MTNQEQIITTQTQQLPPFRGFFAQLREAWYLFISNFWRFVGLNLISIFVPFTLLAAVVLVPFLPFLFPVIWEKFAVYFAFLSGIVGLLVGLAAIVFSIIGFIALFVLINDEKEGKIGRSLKMGFRLFFRFLGGGILISLMVGLGFVFFLIPGMILLVILSFWPFVVVKENIGIISAIKRCFQIIKGHFWSVLLRYFTFFVMALLVHLLFSLLMSLLWPISFGAAIVIFLLYLVTVVFLINVLNFIFVYVVYKDVSARKMVDPRAVYKLSVREKILLIVLIILLSASFLFSIFKGKQPTVRPQITPEEELMYQFLKEQDTPIELPLENVPPILPEEEIRLTPEAEILQRLEDLKKIQGALDNYFQDHGEYPKTSGVLGRDLVCLVSYEDAPELSGFIRTGQFNEDVTLCSRADKIYLESLQLLPSVPDFDIYYDALCSIECLPGEKSDFYAITFNIKAPADLIDVAEVAESGFENLISGTNCLTSKGLNIIGENAGCLSQGISDTDGDGLDDFREVYIYKTDRLNSDTDGDGYLDGDEVRDGYNPLGPGQLVR